jgi:hypothetical protein
LAFTITLKQEIEVKPDEQHMAFKWWKTDKLLEDPTVHQNTKTYFK